MSGLDDPKRLRQLARAGLLDAAAGEPFDRLTRVVCEVLGVPASTVTFVEPHRQLFAGATGLGEPWASTRETPLGYSFCQHCVLSARPFVVDDATVHPLLKDSPAIEELGVVSYAGVPIISRDGTALGTLCAIDHKPRGWSERDLELLRELAAAAGSEVERRVLEVEVARRRGKPASFGAVESGDAAARLNISALANRTGIAADTLRKWEQRYGIIRPFRTAGGQRRYTERDVARVEWLRDRLAEGYRIGEAARLLGEGDVPTAQSPPQSRARIFDAVVRGDARDVGRLLEQSFALSGVEETLTGVVAPLLEDIGDAWADGRLGVANEHLATEAIRARLVALIADARGPVRGVAVLSCPPGERHDLGLLMLAILLRADGWQVAYLGADTPLDDAFAMARRLDAELLCLSVAMRERARELTEAFAGQRLSSDLKVVVGGRGATPTLARRIGAVHVNADLRRSVKTLRRYAT